MTPVVSWDDANSEAGNSEVVSEPETDVDADREDAAMASASSASVAAPNATGIVVPIRLDHTYTEYCGNHIFENGLLTMTLIPGGYITYPGGSISAPSYHFYLCDHEGNNRIVTNINGNIEQANDYTPFGVLMENAFTDTTNQRYKYNGKELDRMHGLDLYDYGARLYDAPLGRWHVMDPLCEKYYSVSPYVYCVNNPLKFVDPDGKQIVLLGNNHDKNIILNCMQQLSNDELYYDKRGIVRIKNYGTRNTKKKLSIGSHLIRTVAFDRDHVMQIGINLPGFENVNGEKDAGRNAIVNINPTYVPSDGRPLYIGLAHEMIHGLRTMRGISINYHDRYTHVIKPRKTERIPKEEGETIGFRGNQPITENAIRAEHGLPQRESYER